MGEHNAGAPVRRSIGDDLPDRERRAGLIAAVAGEMEAVRLIIEMSDPQAFAPRIFFRKAAGEEGPRRFDAIELQREFGTLIPHSFQLCVAALTAHSNRIRNGANLEISLATWTTPL